MNEALALAVAYLLGSIPFGWVAGRMRGVDPRTVGSGNIGATNVFRTLGRRIGIAVMVLDIAKGSVAVLIARALTDSPWPLLAAGAAILGHVFPVWLRFRGGKGVAVAGGAVIALTPLPALVVLGVWAVLVGATRYVSVGSIAAALTYPVAVLLWGEPWPTLVFSVLAALAVVLKHRANIGRLARGTELRLDLARRRPPAAG
ncbi:MAG TPA: glycerol-3-phosphate 1-O-acyltransferase PlsY [Miltoncostaeaceae bacterium]|nr:glycerol-3-phosphate 1-O-acyltransferase PlsY [Miltoncostaeaceae bacterium]